LDLSALATLVCLPIVAQNLASGQLLTTPDRYLADMWSGDLNLGSSIRALRKRQGLRGVHQLAKRRPIGSRTAENRVVSGQWQSLDSANGG
jgi:hypothetical protein